MDVKHSIIKGLHMYFYQILMSLATREPFFMGGHQGNYRKIVLT